MSQINFNDQQQLNSLISEDFSQWSDPLLITQAMINDYAELSGDKLWIHTDEERCKTQSPFKTTIAHGFLILSLLTKMPSKQNVLESIIGYKQIFNYGSNKLRFMNPVPVNSEIHCRSRVKAINVSEHKTQVTMEQQVNVVGSDKPSLMYELIFVLM